MVTIKNFSRQYFRSEQSSIQVGTAEVRVGTDGPQVGTKKQLVPYNLNVFNAGCPKCAGLGRNFFSFLKKPEECSGVTA